MSNLPELAPEQEKYVNHVAFAGLFGGFVYAFGNRLYKLAIAQLVIWILGIAGFLSISIKSFSALRSLSFILSPISFFIGIYLLVRGRRLAWRTGTWDTFEQFRKRQKKIILATIIFLIVGIGLVIFLSYIFAQKQAGFLKGFINEPAPPVSGEQSQEQKESATSSQASITSEDRLAINKFIQQDKSKELIDYNPVLLEQAFLEGKQDGLDPEKNLRKIPNPSLVKDTSETFNSPGPSVAANHFYGYLLGYVSGCKGVSSPVDCQKFYLARFVFISKYSKQEPKSLPTILYSLPPGSVF